MGASQPEEGLKQGLPPEPDLRTALACSLVLGLVVGVPYYGLPFFYDYFESPVASGGFGWSRPAVILGLPIGALFTLLAGFLLRRVALRHAMPAGVVVCAIALMAMSRLDGSLAIYYLLWTLYMAGWTFGGPIAHQILLTRVYHQRRGVALAVSALGISVLGSLSVDRLAGPVTAAFGFRAGLFTIGALVLLALPGVWYALRSAPPEPVEPRREGPAARPRPAGSPFWLLLIGSTLSIGAIGAISQHLKLILRERGFSSQAELDLAFGKLILIMLLAGGIGRLLFGWAADRFPKRHVVTASFLLMACATPLLFFVGPGRPGLLTAFAVVYGLGLGADFLLVPVLAAELYGAAAMARVMALIVPANVIGQTWFPYGVSLLWSRTGSYDTPIAAILLSSILGRLTLALLPSARDGDAA